MAVNVKIEGVAYADDISIYPEIESRVIPTLEALSNWARAHEIARALEFLVQSFVTRLPLFKRHQCYIFQI